jgi:hypothetical protein
MSLITHSNVLVRHENRYSIGLISLVYLLRLSKTEHLKKKTPPSIWKAQNEPKGVPNGVQNFHSIYSSRDIQYNFVFAPSHISKFEV